MHHNYFINPTLFHLKYRGLFLTQNTITIMIRVSAEESTIPDSLVPDEWHLVG
jgi:hypothetical protein